MLLSGDQLTIPASRGRAGGWIIAFIFFIAVLPTVKWMEFSYGIESIHVATVLEIERTGNWITPTLNEEPRVKKPPLPAWITAAFVPKSAVAAIDSARASANDPAYENLAIYTRLPALIAAAIAVGLVCEIGIVLGGGAVGIFSACAFAATALLIHKHARQAIPDIYLMLFLAISVWGLVRALFLRRWDGWLIAGVGLGLGLMCKGPVILLQAVVPVIAARLLFGANEPGTRDRRYIPAAIGGAVLMLAIGLWWFVLVYLRDPTVASTWFSEITREGALDQEPGKFYVYVMLLPWLHPWTVLAIAGIVLVLVRRKELRTFPHLRTAAVGLIGVVLPLALMALAKDRKERYMLPMLVPAAVMIGGVLYEHVKGLIEKRTIDRIAIVFTWLLVAMGLVLVPWLGGVIKPNVKGLPEYSKGFADLMVFTGLPLVGVMIWLSLKRPTWAPPAITICSLIGGLIVAWGYSAIEQSQSEQRPLAELIRREYPAARTFFRISKGDTSTSNMAIYLNRAVPEMPEPETVQPIDVPQILVVDRRKGPIPEAPSPLWREFWRNEVDRPTRFAFVMEKRN